MLLTVYFNYCILFPGKLKEANNGEGEYSKNVDILDLINFTFVICTTAQLASNNDGFDTHISLRGPRKKKEQSLMMPRPHPEMYENQHKRFAQHIGPPRRGGLMAGQGCKNSFQKNISLFFL